MDVMTVAGVAAAVLALLAVAARTFSEPLKLLLKAGLNTALGLAALLAVNATAGIELGLNLFNALVVGVLGVPGLVLLILVQWVVT